MDGVNAGFYPCPICRCSTNDWPPGISSGWGGIGDYSIISKKMRTKYHQCNTAKDRKKLTELIDEYETIQRNK